MIRTLKAVGAALALGALAAGCATGGAQVEPTNYGPLRLAFTAPVETLEANAAAGDEPSVYALSFLTSHGLRGVPEDEARAEALRGRLGPVTTMTAITQYIPGIDGAPGRVHVMNVPVTRPGAIRIEALDRCGETLLIGLEFLARDVCGDEAYAELAPLAAPVRTGLLDRIAAEVDPAQATDCDGTGQLWMAAGPALEGGDLARAEVLTDRIIALCGEDKRSWHPRVMRALIATEAGDPALALDLLAPVPRPAPAPIGGYVSFVAMQAHAAAGDWPAYARERDALVAASIDALVAEPAARGTRRLGEFTVGDARVHAFERETPFGRSLTALMVMLVQTRGEQDPLRTYYLTTSPDMLGGDLPRYFLDEYRCDGRSTLMYFDPASAPPSFEDVRALVGQRLTGDLIETSGSSFNFGLNACQFPVQVAPGLGDDRSAPPSDNASSTAGP